jgi:hypothetical protein
MKHVIIIIMALFVCGIAKAQSSSTSSLNLAIPSTSPNFQNDRIRAGDLECDMAIGSATNVEFGVVGIINDNSPYDYLTGSSAVVNPNMKNNEFIKDVGVYARIIIPIGAPKQRLNCNILYELELEKKRLEVFKLRQEIDRLRNLQFENQ